MRIYKVSTIKLKSGITAVAWAPAEGKAKKLRRELAEAHGLRPLKDVEIVAVDVLGGKAGLLQWLNENHGGELLSLPQQEATVAEPVKTSDIPTA